MRIVRIKLDNYRCHGQFEQDFPAGINLLIGKNGTGKSSVLEAIGMIVCGESGRGTPEGGAVGPLKKHANIEIEFVDRAGVRWLAKKRIGAGGRAVQLWRNQGTEWQPESSEILPGLFGLSKKDAKTVYRTMIVAEQNQFTLPFMGTPANRMAVFDSVFGISQWRELGTKSGIETPYSNSVSALEARLLTLEEQMTVSGGAGLEAEEATLGQEVTRRENESLLLAGAEQNSVRAASAWRALDESRQNAERAKIRSAELCSRVEALGEDRAWLEENAASLRRLELLERDLGMVRVCHEAALVAEAARVREQGAELRLSEAREECVRLKRQLEQSTKDARHSQAGLARSIPLANDLKQAWARLEGAISAVNQARAALDVLGKTGEDLEELRCRRDRLAGDVERWQTLQALKETLLGENKDAAARHRALSAQREILGTGRCPFFGEACQNLAGRANGPQDEIGRMVQSLADTTRQAAERLNQVNAELSGLERAGAELGAVTQAIAGAEARERERTGAGERLRQAVRECEAAEAAFDRAFQVILALPEDTPLRPALHPGIAEGRLAQMESVRSALQAWQAADAAEEKKRQILVEEEARRRQLSGTAESEALRARDEAGLARSRYAMAREQACAGANAVLADLPSEADSFAVSSIEQRLGALRTPLVALAEEAAARRGRLAGEDALQDQYVTAREACDAAHKTCEQAREAVDGTMAVLRHSLVTLDLPDEVAMLPRSESEALALRDRLGARVVEVSRILGEARAARDSLARKKAEHLRLAGTIASCRKELGEARRRLVLVQGLRTLLKGLGPWIARYALPLVARQATAHFRRITGRSEQIFWSHSETASYCITLAESEQDSGARTFEHLSGGEQVAVALSLRAALVESLSSSGFVIFDEPTINLDADARASLASSFRTIFGRIEQAFVITHDDSFEAMADNELRFG